MLPLFATRSNPLVDLTATERDPFAALMRALYAGASEPLRDWLKGNGPVVKDVAADAVITLRPRAPERTRATGGGMSLRDAIHWAHARAQELVGATVFEGENMVEDLMGASMSTYPTLLAYTEVPDPDAIPLSTHAVAIEALRTHAGSRGTKGGQLPRGEWEAAYEAIRAAAEAEGAPMPEPESRPTLRSTVASPKSGERDGSTYRFNAQTGWLTLDAPYNRAHGTALLPLVKKAEATGKVASGSWRRAAPNTKDFSIMLRPSAARGLADVVEEVYPHLAAVLRQHAEYWMGLAGEQESTVPERTVSVVGDANGGEILGEGIRWTVVPEEKAVHVAGDFFAKGMKEKVGAPSLFVLGPQGYYFACPISEPKLKVMIAEFDRLGKTATAAAFRSFLPAWLTLQTGVNQSREHGEVPEEAAEWDLRSSTTASGRLSETIRLRLPRSVSYDFTSNVKGAKFANGRNEINVRNVPEAASWLRDKGLVRFAEALTRAFGGMKGVIDEEAARCAVLLSMSRGVRGAVNPEDITDPKAQEAISQVRAALRQRVVNPKLQPFPFQLVGMAFAKLADYRTLIADAPGLGKTIQAIGTMLVDPERLLPALIVCPKNVAENWVEEIAAWMPNVRTQSVSSQGALDPSARIYIMGYDTLRDRVDEFVTMSAAAVPALMRSSEAVTEQIRKKEDKKEPVDALVHELTRLQTLLKQAQEYPESERIRYLIVDEAHKFKNPVSKQSKAGRMLTDAIPHALFLSGTPMMNNMAELHAVLSMLHPDVWGSEQAFRKQYTEERQVEKLVKGKRKNVIITVLKNAPELHQRMGCQIIRRRKMDALADLVLPKRRKKVAICVTPEEAAVYDEATRQYERYIREYAERIVKKAVDDEVEEFLAESGMAREDVLAAERTEILNDEYGIRKGYFDDKALRARGIPLDDVIARASENADEKIDALLASKGMTRAAIADRVQEQVDERVENAMRAQVLTQLNRLLELIGQFKVPAVVDMVKAIHAQKAPANVTKSERVAPEGVVIFAKHASVMDAYQKALKAAGIKVGVISGDVKSTPKARMKVVKDFQNGDIDVVLASEAGREGLTLTRAKYLIMAQRYWNPAAEQQAEDRIHRIGQKRDATVLIPYIVRANPDDAEGATADDYMQRIIVSKRGLAGEAIGDDEIEESTLGEDEVSEEAENLLEGMSEEFSAFATAKALRKGYLCVDKTLTRDSVEAVRRVAQTGYETEMRQNPRAFNPRPVPSRSEVQTVLFDRRAWSKAAAEAWLRHHGYDARKVDTTEHYHRFRQHDPHHYVPGSFRTIAFTSSIKAVVGRRV